MFELRRGVGGPEGGASPFFRDRSKGLLSQLRRLSAGPSRRGLKGTASSDGYGAIPIWNFPPPLQLGFRECKKEFFPRQPSASGSNPDRQDLEG